MVCVCKLLLYTYYIYMQLIVNIIYVMVKM